MILNDRNRFAFLIGRQSGIRSTDDAVEQLSAQLRKERSQYRYDLAEKEKEIAILLRELGEARYELARRDRGEAFTRAPSPSAMKH